VAFVTAEQANRALDVLSGCPLSAQSRVIGTVGDRGDAIVEALGALGNSRILDPLSGEQLPRIC